GGDRLPHRASQQVRSAMRCLFVAGALAAGAAAAAGAAPSDQPPRLVNARLETRSAAAGLEPVFRAAVQEARSPAPIGYAVPTTEGRHEMCCWSSTDEVGLGCPGCRLEGKGSFMVRGEGRPAGSTVSLEDDQSIVVLFRAEDSQLGKIRTFSPSCALDA